MCDGACGALFFFFFQAEDGIRDHAQSRGLGDVYKRQMFDICVLTTYTEGISNTLLEYMAFSKPIVTTNCPGTTELLENNKEAILIPPSSPNYLFNAIYKLLNNKSKMDLLGKNANEKLKKSFSTFNMISNYNKLYLSLFKQQNTQNQYKKYD
eukprot:TRINITY_DN18902_c0_g1_i2.p2 TRINITY_DN18902_c0_g1~~TRINITY_DN18902_c0_g1_i2.p2  ORF type:complete len:153 (+),score=31.74 TRINITY_DN18902_c0_g1_i2:43-501(+)